MDSEWRFWLDAIIIPLGGVFNILIYTRPKVLKLKEKFPMLMKYELFIIVVMKGGEMPSMADVRAALDMANEGIVAQDFEDYDVVCRINQNFSIPENMQEDYGKRTNINFKNIKGMFTHSLFYYGNV